jgi:hypothetical protein
MNHTKVKGYLLTLISILFYLHSYSQQTPILYSKNISHKFSDQIKADTFKIYITGQSLIDGIVNFEIINYSGEKIYFQQFESKFLFNYDFMIEKELINEETFIKKRIDSFFNEENFKKPAIKEDEEFESDYSDKANWDAIKSDKNSIGFHYLIGEEDGRWIAYSKELKKVVLYFNCC